MPLTLTHILAPQDAGGRLRSLLGLGLAPDHALGPGLARFRRRDLSGILGLGLGLCGNLGGVLGLGGGDGLRDWRKY